MSAELDRAVKRLLALPTPGPSLVDQLGDAHAEIKRLRGLLAEVNETVRIPTPQGTRAYTHFMRDFDKIRAICVERDLTKMEASNG